MYTVRCFRNIEQLDPLFAEGVRLTVKRKSTLEETRVSGNWSMYLWAGHAHIASKSGDCHEIYIPAYTREHFPKETVEWILKDQQETILHEFIHLFNKRHTWSLAFLRKCEPWQFAKYERSVDNHAELLLRRDPGLLAQIIKKLSVLNTCSITFEVVGTPIYGYCQGLAGLQQAIRE